MEKINLQTINRVDERGRVIGIEFFLSSTPKQADSHGFSYLGARELYKEAEEVMGLELPYKGGYTK